MQRVTSSNWPHLVWAMFLAGFIIRYQPEMGMEKHAWKTGGNLYFPASIFSPRHYKQEFSIVPITTRSQVRSSTVICYNYAVQRSDVMLFWSQYPTVLRHIPATKEWGYDGRVPGTAATFGYEHIPDRTANASVKPRTNNQFADRPLQDAQSWPLQMIQKFLEPYRQKSMMEDTVKANLSVLCDKLAGPARCNMQLYDAPFESDSSFGSSSKSMMAYTVKANQSVLCDKLAGPPPCFHLDKELIAKVCYQAPSPGKEPENSQTFTLNRSAVFFRKGTSGASQSSPNDIGRTWITARIASYVLSDSTRVTSPGPSKTRTHCVSQWIGTRLGTWNGMLDIVSYFDANESDVHGQPSYDHAQRSWEDSSDTSILVLSNLKQPPARAGPRSIRACPLTPGVMNQEGTGPPVPISTQHCADCDLALQRLADAHRVHHDAPRPRPCNPRFLDHAAHGPCLQLPLADYRSRRGKAAVAGTTMASTRPPGGVCGCISMTSGQERLA